MKKILAIVLMFTSLSVLGLSKQHLEALVMHAKSLVLDASKVKGYDEKKKLLDEAHSVMSALTSHIGYVNDQYANVLSVLHKHGESVDKFKSDESDIANQINNLDVELKIQSEELDKARKYETAEGIKSVHVGSAVQDAKIAGRLRVYHAKSKRANRRRGHDIRRARSSMEAEGKIASASRNSWPKAESFVDEKKVKRSQDSALLKDQVALDHDSYVKKISSWATA